MKAYLYSFPTVGEINTHTYTFNRNNSNKNQKLKQQSIAIGPQACSTSHLRSGVVPAATGAATFKILQHL
ncbi:hypothetical protein AWZ03_003907 [Drosophila navojoa]|uniref:Uncharacterized protein n=1 Tax=Drosophila navojoa TaxID=7232 RepID=A0A484BLG4_DRONA|nr:hypothetical protein AWZ03_003907 [Drosophila navojoa]